MRSKLLLPIALFAASVAGAQSLTLTNLKGPIAKASGVAPAKSIADLWKQINALPAASPTPTSTALPVDTAPVIPPHPKPTPVALSGVLDEGDSISVFWGGNHTGIYATNHSSVTYHGQAVGGAHLEFNPTNDLYTRFDADAALRPAYVTVLIGANDMPEVGLDWSPWKGGTSSYIKELFAYTDKWRATGAKVLLGTILPQCRANYDNTLSNRNASAINDAIRASVGTHVDAIVDYAADPDLGTRACDTAWYSDGLHPTDGHDGYQGGQGRMAQLYTAALDGMIAGTPAPSSSPEPIPTPTPSPTPTPKFVPTAATTARLEGLDAIPSNFDVGSLLQGSWGNGLPAPSGKPDVVGAFRFNCAPSHNSYADPIKYPGQNPDPKKMMVHLHTFFGNTLADGYSTYESLRTTGDSTCNNMLNRSAYWIPAMMTPAGKVVMPNMVSIYYKRLPESDPQCQKQGKACVALPRGLRYIFGYNSLTGDRLGSAEITCVDQNGGIDYSGLQRSIPAAAKNCPVGARLEVKMPSPQCWDGKSLDSADHSSHMAYASYGDWGYEKCDDAHPYVVPTFTIAAFYTVDETLDRSGDMSPNAKTWYLASDRMAGMTAQVPGTTFHADWFGAWDDTILQTWTANCINKLLNCSGGDLGDGRQMKLLQGYSGPTSTILVDPPAATAVAAAKADQATG